MKIDPLAGKPAPSEILVNVPKLITSYYSLKPDANEWAERVTFGTSGHRGSSLSLSFNEDHILAITQAICFYRKSQNINGPLFIGMDTHALSEPALVTALEVLSANDVFIFLAENNEYTPTPVISHAILNYNRGRKENLADGIIITPSHNPPEEGGFKYNPPHGGPAEEYITKWIENQANALLKNQLRDIKRCSLKEALSSPQTKTYPFRDNYICDLKHVIDFNLIRDSKIRLGVDPLGGAGVFYWDQIAQTYGLNLQVVSHAIDSTFRFMSVDWDGQIRMDPSSPYAMQKLIDMKEKFDIAFAADTDHDRHGIVVKSKGLLPSNHYLCAAISYLFQHRPLWQVGGIGKTAVSSHMIDKIATYLNRTLYEVPVGFKWFVEGLFTGSLNFAGEESAGASFSRFDGTVWTTDKDGIIPGLLAAEMTAKVGKDPGEQYEELNQQFGPSFFNRLEAPISREKKILLKNISEKNLSCSTLAGDKILSIRTDATGNHQPIGGIKVCTQQGWFAARPSGTEDIYKIYAESFISKDHLIQIEKEAEITINKFLYENKI